MAYSATLMKKAVKRRDERMAKKAWGGAANDGTINGQSRTHVLQEATGYLAANP